MKSIFSGKFKAIENCMESSSSTECTVVTLWQELITASEQESAVEEKCSRHFSGGGVTSICRDMGMCHYFGYFFGGCSQSFGYLFGLFPDFWVSFFGYSRIFGYHFLVKFDFFKNNPDFGVSILIFPSMTLWNVA